MKILAIDTALPAVSVCIWDSNTAQTAACESIPMTRGHAEHLLPVIQRVIANNPGGLEGIVRIAVTVGPGSFTGIRVGIAAAKGIALAKGITLVGVSTLAAIAAPFVESNATELVVSSVDARHSQVYIQAFGKGGQHIIAPCLMPIREAVRALGSGSVRLVGPGSALLAIEAATMGLRANIGADSDTPDIAYVAKLGALADPALAPADPLYLSPVSAKPNISSQDPAPHSTPANHI